MRWNGWNAAIGCVALAGLAHAKAPAPPTAPVEKPLAALHYSPSLDLTSMDKSVDPCVDFYTYSCGGWMKKNPIPPDQASWSVYGKLTDDTERFLWGLLQQASQNDARRSPVEQKIGDYFAACMDEGAVEKLGRKPLDARFAEIAALKSTKEVPALIARAHLGGDEAMFGFGSDQDFENSNQVIAFVVGGGLGLPDRDYYLKDDAHAKELRTKYLAHVARMLELVGDKPAAAEAAAARVLKIETALAQASLSRVDKRDPYKLFHKMKRAELAALTPDFDWARYLETLGAPTGLDTFNVTEPEFMKRLASELKSTDLASWKDYLRWHAVHSAARYLSKPFVDADFDFYSHTLRGVKEQRPRWKRCVSWIDRDLGEALGQVYVAKAFSPELKQRALSMTVEIEKAMEEELKALPWMSAETKKRALEKLHAMVNKIGYPDKWRDYSSVVVRRDDFLGDVERASIFEMHRQLGKIGKPVDRGEWSMTPPTVNAYYSGQMNDMNFPAGVLQPPLYDPKSDDAPNYGDTGATIGHELTHGFDDEGRQFDAKGNLKDWWTKKDAEEFDKRAQCIVQQYGQYIVVDDIKLNSKLSLGEDIADLGGTILALKAWQHVTARERLKPIDGFTPEQRFFIGMAQWVCNNERDEVKRLNAITNPHSPGQYRINGVVVNIPEFGRAFSCKAGQPMVKKPADVCSVW